jgi:hypothetical protein
MSECSAEISKDCKFYKKATRSEECMHRSISLGDCFHCDCLKAQCDCQGVELEMEEIIAEENKEGVVPT